MIHFIKNGEMSIVFLICEGYYQIAQPVQLWNRRHHQNPYLKIYKIFIWLTTYSTLKKHFWFIKKK